MHLPKPELGRVCGWHCALAHHRANFTEFRICTSLFFCLSQNFALSSSICLWTYLFNKHTHTHTCAGRPSIKGSTSESSAEIESDEKFYRIKPVSSNHRFPLCTERRVNFSYTWHSLRITASSSLLKRNAITVTPHLNDWYVKHAQSCWRTLGRKNTIQKNEE